MAITDQISQLVTPAVEAQGLFLEEVQLVSPGKHRIVTCIVDGPASLNLDQVTAVSRAISELLDEAAADNARRIAAAKQRATDTL